MWLLGKRPDSRRPFSLRPLLPATPLPPSLPPTGAASPARPAQLGAGQRRCCPQAALLGRVARGGLADSARPQERADCPSRRSRSWPPSAAKRATSKLSTTAPCHRSGSRCRRQSQRAARPARRRPGTARPRASRRRAGRHGAGVSQRGGVVGDYLAHAVEQRLTSGLDSGLNWYPRWWAHPEAISRPYPLWQAWETLRVSDPQTGMSI
ncbi:DUF4913 domain-containing protein [Micromonospora sp. NPDC023737]|uniref:DUF4913 domain-containing protein n=1 Tax=unclassified Micromonospora TaxID=2617518 RepID=UPI0033DE40D0